MPRAARFTAWATIAVLLFPTTVLTANDAVDLQGRDPAQPLRQQLDAMIEEYEELMIGAPLQEELVRALEISRERLGEVPDSEFEALAPEIALSVQQLRTAIHTLQGAMANRRDRGGVRSPGLPEAPYPEVSWFFAIEAFTGDQEQPSDDVEESRGGFCSYATTPSPNDQFLMLNVALHAEGLKETAGRICGLAEDFPPPASLIGLACIVTDILYIVAKGIVQNEAMCSSFMTDAEVTASYRRVGHLHGDVEDAQSDLLDRVRAAQLAINAEVDFNETLLRDLDAHLVSHDENFTLRADWIMGLLEAQERFLIEYRGESLRNHIERRLSESDHKPVTFFVLPEAFGGKLEVVRQIVEETLADAEASGANVQQASRLFEEADQAVASGAFEDAFDLFGRAYRSALN